MVAKQCLASLRAFFTAILEADDTKYSTAREALNRLHRNEWTTLLIQDTVGWRVTGLINHQGALAIERGSSGTVARRFPKGRVLTRTK